MADELQQGADFYNSLVNTSRRNDAYNALAKTYGPITGDPELASATANAQTTMANQPNIQAANDAKAAALVQAQKDFGAPGGNPAAQTENLANEDTSQSSQRQAQIRALTMLKGAVNSETGSIDPAAIDNTVGKNASALGFQNDAQYQQFKAGLTAPGGAANIDQHIAGLLAPQKVVGAKPIVYGKDGQAYEAQTSQTGQTTLVPLGDVSQASKINADNNRPIARENANAHMIGANAQAYTAGIGGQGGAPLPGDARPSANFGGGNVLPKPSTDLIGAGNPPGSTTANPGIAPVPRRGMSALPNADGTGYTMVPTSSVPKSAAGQQNVVDPASGQITQRTVQMTQSPQATAVAKADLGQMDLQYKRTSDVLDKALTQIGPLTAGIGGRVSEALGTPARAALDASLQTAKSNIALLTANMARNGGKSVPVSVRNLQEFKAYQDALGAINPNAAPSVVAQQIQTAKQQLQALQSGVHAKYQATYGDSVLGGSVAATQSNAPQGWSIKAVP